MADLPDYIDTTWAKKRIASNTKKIAQLQARLPKLKGDAATNAKTQVDDLNAENRVLQDKISALGLSGKDTAGTTGNYVTVPVSNSLKGQAAGSSGAAEPVPQPPLSKPILALIGLLIAGALLAAWRIIKRRKHGK